MAFSLSVLAIFWLLCVACILRIFSLLPAQKSSGRVRVSNNTSTTRKLAVFLGSGGHTSEAIALLSSLDFTRFSPRIYIVSDGDNLSAQKARDLESKKCASSSGNNFAVLTIPRARRVHQSLFSIPLTAFWSLSRCMQLVTLSPLLSSSSSQPFADVLILNGPGTCLSLCIAVYVSKFIGCPAPRLIYVESFARVRSLSLSGKLLRPLVDRFVVQWPQPLADGGRGDSFGWLV
ncbi:glycosyltransferase family 1 protein [Guyanagaster necrorhizus]|uniref:UDP-N-acetylglucosamine transferase subunit ALG14 n=1 Tax=Guyanagaster necrorhizus TaxID=856835 RepID=A0A9P7VG14_9AGAR|nr:glycosyltransferase family 1 protein [Guyanagaster necrorhizus MCA 3950]KAG7440034.1 glycosyltransferase family 1 protein [Guyanagaster necrorhizus MCA 3950]